MNKITFAIVCGVLFAGSAIFSQDANAELRKNASAPEIQQQLAQPDGVAIFLPPDGFQIFARGTGTYDFDDVDERQDAMKEAVLKAKANLAKFMKEKITTEEAFASASKKVKSITSHGQTQTANVTKESVKTNAEIIRNSADAILKGVIVLKEQKIPHQGSSGEIQVTVGISSKTLKAVEKLVRAIDATPEQGQSAGAGAGASTPVDGSNNKAETREAVTDF